MSETAETAGAHASSLGAHDLSSVLLWLVLSQQALMILAAFEGPQTHMRPCMLVTDMRLSVTWQEPLLALLVKHMDAKGKQAKLKSPAELQARDSAVCFTVFTCLHVFICHRTS